MLVASLTLGWAMANSAWLLATGVQLQPGVFAVLLSDPLEFWPIVQKHLAARLSYGIPIMFTLVVCMAWLVWRFIRPVALEANRRRYSGRASAAGVVLILALVGKAFSNPSERLASVGDVLNFSSHWYALAAVVAGASNFADVDTQVRPLPRAGERKIGLPDAPAGELPTSSCSCWRVRGTRSPHWPTPSLTPRRTWSG